MLKLEKHPKLRVKMVCIFQKMKQTSQTLSTNIVQPIFKGMIQSIASKLIKLGCGRFIIPRKWFRQFMKHYMCWIYYVTTIITNKIPAN
jgi:hypothetical protein